MAPLKTIAWSRGDINEKLTFRSNCVNILREQLAIYAGKEDNLTPASHTLCVAVDVSLKAHKPVEAAIFFSRVQKHTELTSQW